MTRSARLAPMVLIGLAALSGCAPHSADLTSGTLTAFISETTSSSILKDLIVPERDYADTFLTIDCRDFAEIDPRLTNEEQELLRIGTGDPYRRIDVCRNNDWPSGEGPVHEEWLLQSPYWIVTEELDPWRGEAVITSEGDLQIGFHHRLKGGADFRFAIAVDPDFAPQRCEQTPQGVKPGPYDGDWVAEWSKDLAELGDAMARDEELASAYGHYSNYLDGSLYYVNAYGYQINWYQPTCTFDGSADNCYWYFPESFSAGFGAGKFGEDQIASRSPLWGEPSVYTSISSDVDTVAAQTTDLWYCDPDAFTEADWGNARDAECGFGTPTATYGDLIDHVDGVATEMSAEVAVVNKDNPLGNADVAHLYPFVHDNTWRVPDGRPEDLDGWVELHYNSIVFSKDSVLEVGGSAKGAFTMIYDGTTSLTRVLVKGTFEIDRIRKDHWVTEDLRVEKAAEAGYDYESSLCTIL